MNTRVGNENSSAWDLWLRFHETGAFEHCVVQRLHTHTQWSGTYAYIALTRNTEPYQPHSITSNWGVMLSQGPKIQSRHHLDLKESFESPNWNMKH